MTESQTQPIDAIAWIHIQDRRLLCVRTQGKDAFYLPGGKRKTGESDAAALIREVQEELGVGLQPQSVRFFARYRAKAHGYTAETMVSMACYHATYIGTLCPSGEIAEMAWMTSSDRDRCAPVNQIVIDDLVQQGLLD